MVSGQPYYLAISQSRNLNQVLQSVDEKIAAGEFRIAGQIDSKFAETGFIAGGRQMGNMHLTAGKLAELAHRLFCRRIGRCADTQRDQSFVKVQADTAAFQDIPFQHCDRIDDVRRNQHLGIRNFRQLLDGIPDTA